jgi:hypothetical protein
MSSLQKSVGLADFQKLKEIGKGAIGKVYVVRMKGTDDLYAMKLIKKYDMVQRNKVKRILTEREILATADHPFIVSLYYSFQSQHSLVFIMEYCAGGEFYRLIQRQPFRCLKGIFFTPLSSRPYSSALQKRTLDFMLLKSSQLLSTFIRWGSFIATSNLRTSLFMARYSSLSSSLVVLLTVVL